MTRLIMAFSQIAHSFSDAIGEIDLNPVIVHEFGCSIVDALIVPLHKC
ncbi:MAG: hypothetical protein GKR96_11350 [Gammaproteobacteria bacterium]|nr:hypothetical protein [Gammaproteobacteria bacterium]